MMASVTAGSRQRSKHEVQRSRCIVKY